MKQYQVPQFITVEDKVFGPLTIKQTLYLGAGAVVIGLAYAFLKRFLFIPITIVAGGLAAAFAFLKINDQPFPRIIKNAFLYILKPRLYIWKKERPQKSGPKSQKRPEVMVKSVPKLSESKLSDLAWSLDIKTHRE
jgi:hypothetical protein